MAVPTPHARSPLQLKYCLLNFILRKKFTEAVEKCSGL